MGEIFVLVIITGLYLGIPTWIFYKMFQNKREFYNSLTKEDLISIANTPTGFWGNPKLTSLYIAYQIERRQRRNKCNCKTCLSVK